MADDDNPLGRARALYNRRISPQRARELRGLADQSAAESAALTATTALCEFLNRWNDADGEQVARAEAAVAQALRADPELFLAHYAQGFIHRAKGEHQAGLEAFARTIERNPKFARAYAQKGEQLVYLGYPQEGIAEVERAMELSPDSSVRGYFYWVIGRARFFMEQDEEAIPWLRRSIRNWPSVWYNRLYLVSAHAHAGERSAARRVLAAFEREFPGYTLARVIENERATPSSHDLVRRGRERFHRGLRDAGMK